MNLRNQRRRYLCLLALHRRRRAKRRDPRAYVREINHSRATTGEFSSLVNDLANLDDERYFEFFRMSQFRFQDLLIRVNPLIQHSSTHRIPISTAERLALTLRYLASEESQISLAIRYRMGRSTVSDIISETTKALWTALQPEFLSEPSHEDYINIAKDFWTLWNFPLCLGAIDGKHIKIRKPPNSGSTFFNYKGYFSTILMACCDAKYRFTMVDIGGFGSQGDPGTFSESNFGKNILNDRLPAPSPNCLPGSNVVSPHVFVADEAFQMRINLMRPFPKARLNDDTRIFNYRLSRARRVIENAFGILVARWRILLRTIDTKVENADHIVKACIVLHNYLLLTDASNPPTCRYNPSHFVDYENRSGRVRPGDWRAVTKGSRLNSVGRLGSNMRGKEAELVRDNFVRYFLSQEGAVPWQEVAALST